MQGRDLPIVDESHAIGFGHGLAPGNDLASTLNLRNQATRHSVTIPALGLDIRYQATEMQLICERRLGQLLSRLSITGGDRKPADRHRGSTLKDLGITRSQSSRWQRDCTRLELLHTRRWSRPGPALGGDFGPGIKVARCYFGFALCMRCTLSDASTFRSLTITVQAAHQVATTWQPREGYYFILPYRNPPDSAPLSRSHRRRH